MATKDWKLEKKKNYVKSRFDIEDYMFIMKPTTTIYHSASSNTELMMYQENTPINTWYFVILEPKTMREKLLIKTTNKLKASKLMKDYMRTHR